MTSPSCAFYIRPPEGQEKLGKKVDLEPLQVGFDTPRPYYPGMFSSQQGNFGLWLTTITSKPLAKRPLRDIRRKLVASADKYPNLWTTKALPEHLQSVAKAASGFGGVDRWHVNELFFVRLQPRRPRSAHFRVDRGRAVHPGRRRGRTAGLVLR